MYSNGYDITTVYTALKDRVGFRQPTGVGDPTLSSAVTTTNSGRFFQDFHSLVTVNNIKATMEQAGANDATLITFLDNKRKAAIMKALQSVFNEAQIVDQPNKLYIRDTGQEQSITNTGLFVGYEINVANVADAAMQIDALNLYFDAAATFNIYLFKEGKLTHEWLQSVTTVANQIVSIDLTEKVLTSGKYFIGYFQNDLTGAQAKTENVEMWNCNHFFSAQPISAESTGATTFNRDNINYNSQPMGLNLEASSFRDHTKQIVRKSGMFDELIGLVFAYTTIEQIVYAVRSNGTERLTKDEIANIGMQLDLNGVAPISDSPKTLGLRQQIEKEVKRVRTTFYPSFKAVSICE